jgi:hypothetical protein
MKFTVTTLEAFLEDAGAAVEPSSDLGSLDLDPHYGTNPDYSDLRGLTAELCSLREDLSTRMPVRSPQGATISIPERYPLLRKYIRDITWRCERAGSWIRVLPDGFAG